MMGPGRKRRGRSAGPGARGDVGKKRNLLPTKEEGNGHRLLLLLLAAFCGVLLWQYRDPAALGPDAAASVHERGLVARDVSWDSVVAEHGRPWRDSGHRHFLNSVLVYVTPWNSLGYDMAKKFRAKFTHVSPVWYQLKRGGDGLELAGKHDVDKKWIADVCQNGSPMIVPRVVLEGGPLDMLVNLAEQKQAIQLIVDECKDMEYDGIVLEAWTAWAAFNILDKPSEGSGICARSGHDIAFHGGIQGRKYGAKHTTAFGHTATN